MEAWIFWLISGSVLLMIIAIIIQSCCGKQESNFEKYISTYFNMYLFTYELTKYEFNNKENYLALRKAIGEIIRDRRCSSDTVKPSVGDFNEKWLNYVFKVVKGYLARDRVCKSGDLKYIVYRSDQGIAELNNGEKLNIVNNLNENADIILTIQIIINLLIHLIITIMIYLLLTLKMKKNLKIKICEKDDRREII